MRSAARSSRVGLIHLFARISFEVGTTIAELTTIGSYLSTLASLEVLRQRR